MTTEAKKIERQTMICKCPGESALDLIPNAVYDCYEISEETYGVKVRTTGDLYEYPKELFEEADNLSSIDVELPEDLYKAVMESCERLEITLEHYVVMALNMVMENPELFEPKQKD